MAGLNCPLLGMPFVLEEKNGKLVSYMPGMTIKEEPTPLLLKAKQELEEYQRGERKSFDIPLDPPVTNFAKRMYKELLKVGFGETITYGELAKRLNQKGARGVAAALHVNHIILFIPCHRVVAKNGLGGFGIGDHVKKLLLEHEAKYK